jgi:hypothetical protein
MAVVVLTRVVVVMYIGTVIGTDSTVEITVDNVVSMDVVKY